MGPKRTKKLSSDFIEDSNNEETEKLSQGKKPAESGGETFFELSKTRRVTIRSWKGSKLIDIREYWSETKDGDSELKPGKKGISLTVEQWKALMEVAPQINELL